MSLVIKAKAPFMDTCVVILSLGNLCKFLDRFVLIELLVDTVDQFCIHAK